MPRKKSLPLKPDKNIMDMLIKANSYLKHAFFHAGNNSFFDKMQSITLIDESIEYLLRILNYSFDIEQKTNKNFEKCGLSELAGELNSFFKSEYNVQLPYLTDIKLIRQSRNLVQHAMLNPSAEFLRFSTIAERFFEKCLKVFYDLDINTISISSLIDDSTIKQQLRKAEKFISQKEYLKSIVMSRNAFENAIYNSTHNSEIRLNAIPCTLKTREDDEHLNWFIQNIRERLVLNDLNINSKDYNQFKEYLRYIPFEYSKDSHPYTVRETDWTKEEANFCYNFVAQEILNLQAYNTNTNNENDKTNYKTIEKINNIEIKKYENACCTYISDNEIIQLFVVGNKIKKFLDKLEIGHIHTYEIEFYENNTLYSKHKNKFELKAKNCKLVTNEPERWEYSLCTNKILFSQYSEEYSNGKVTLQTQNINEVSADIIYSNLNKYKKVITQKTANAIEKYIKQIGKITTMDELFKIEGMNKELVEALGTTFFL